MSSKTVRRTILTCDKCGESATVEGFERLLPVDWTNIDVIMKNEELKSTDVHGRKDLCPDCTIEFIASYFPEKK
jgi:hypothetical protein